MYLSLFVNLFDLLGPFGHLVFIVFVRESSNPIE